MKHVGIVGIDLQNLPFLKGSKALEASGNNFGNMLFTNAAYQQINNAKHIGFNWNPEGVRASCSSIFIPAANWINKKQDWGFLADLIEKTDLPCTVVGLGSQVDSLADVEEIPEGTKRLLKAIASRSSAVAVRGDFTAEVVRACGVDNVEVLGCPSIFTDGKVPELRSIVPSEIKRIGIGPTRYILNEINGTNRFDKQRQLYQFAIREASSIYYQSEQYEIAVLAQESQPNEKNDELAKSYYGIYDQSILTQNILTKGKYHTSLAGWLSDVRKDDIYVGTRIHGAIAATLAGTPAVLITHDNRTRELATQMGVPSVRIEDFNVFSLYDPAAFISQFDYEKYTRRTELNYKKLQAFYEKNNLVNNLSVNKTK